MSIPTVEDATKKSKSMQSEAHGSLNPQKVGDLVKSALATLRKGRPPGLFGKHKE